jgi:hypothetical protein
MSVSIPTLIADVRRESGLRNNQVLSDDDLTSFLSEAYLDLRDRLIIRFAYWFRKEVSFTLAGGSTGYIFDLATVPDFQMAQGLDLLQNDGSFYPITMLASYMERCQLLGALPGIGAAWTFNGFLGRKYWIDGDNLELLPLQNSQGTYRLVYTPIEQLKAVTVVPITVSSVDVAGDAGGFTQYEFFNVTSQPDWVGGTITVAFASPNTLYNGTSTITAVNGSQVTTSKNWPGGSFTNPASGTATVTFQASGTRSTLPDKLTPWAQYLVLYASIAVRNSRNQSPDALSVRFADIKQRVIDLTKQRSEGVRQAPITRARYGTFGMGSGGTGWS